MPFLSSCYCSFYYGYVCVAMSLSLCFCPGFLFFHEFFNFKVQPPKKAKVGRWLCYNFGNISLNIMTHEARLKYDLESLWGIGWMEIYDVADPEFPMPFVN